MELKRALLLLVTLLLQLVMQYASTVSADSTVAKYPGYDMGSYNIGVQYYVNPVTGNDKNIGTSRSAPFKSLTAAWNLIPKGVRIIGV